MTAYSDVPRSLRPPIWRELIPRRPTRAARRREAPTAAVESPRRTVLVVPGFLAPDRTTAVLRAAIGGAGHRAHPARLGSMNGCSEVLASKLVA